MNVNDVRKYEFEEPYPKQMFSNNEAEEADNKYILNKEMLYNAFRNGYTPTSIEFAKI